MSESITFHNTEVFVNALGLAIDTDKNLIYYLSAAGAKVSLKSIWATVCTNNSKTINSTTWEIMSSTGANPIKAFYNSLPNTNITHMINVHREDNLILACEPVAASITNEERRRALRTKNIAQVISDFVSILNTSTNVPILEEWGFPLWQHAQPHEEGGIKELTTHGDCIGAWLIDPTYNWLELTQDLLEQGHIQFPK